MKNKISLIVLSTVSIAATMNSLCVMPWNSILIDESVLLSQTELDCVASTQHDSFAIVGDTLQDQATKTHTWLQPLRCSDQTIAYGVPCRFHFMGDYLP